LLSYCCPRGAARSAHHALTVEIAGSNPAEDTDNCPGGETEITPLCEGGGPGSTPGWGTDWPGAWTPPPRVDVASSGLTARQPARVRQRNAGVLPDQSTIFGVCRNARDRPKVKDQVQFLAKILRPNHSTQLP